MPINLKTLTFMFVGFIRYISNCLLDERMKTPCSKVLSMHIHLICLFGYLLDGLHQKNITSSVKTRSTFYASINFFCWNNKLYSGYLRMRTNSVLLIGFKLTLIGSLPNSSGIKSSILAIEKDPLAMNKMWSVLTSPYFVETVVP